MKYYLCRILALSFAVAISFSSIAMNRAMVMNQYSDRTKEIQTFFMPYLGKIPTDSKLYSRIGSLKCDGIYNPQVFELVIAVLQLEIGETPDGWFGSGTERKCPIVIDGSTEVFIKIAQACLYFNCEEAPFDGMYEKGTIDAVIHFQKFMCLPETGEVDGITMKVLLSSGGSKARPALGCDCATQLTKEMALALHSTGRTHVGRYLTSKKDRLQKHLTAEEIINIANAGLRFVVFFQEGPHNQEHCTSEQGSTDAVKAIEAAINLKIPKGSTIYGVVDADVEPDLVYPYFLNMSLLIREAGFEFGVYGSRAVCILMHEKGVSKYSYVCGMSYRYKGNFGYPMPLNWAFNQEYELKDRKEKGDERFTFPGGAFDLDRVVVSGIDPGIGGS